ncbi:transposase [Enterobacter kobei]|uniref:transposase n=1 Tax=Enterobacter kobei TaxID=208224 RepID=UPI00388DBFE4
MSNTLQPRRARASYSMDFKLALVEKSYQPGACVARLARDNGINDNLLFTGASVTDIFCPMKYNGQSESKTLLSPLSCLIWSCHTMLSRTMNPPLQPAARP